MTTPEQVVALYNKLLNSHKRLPIDARERFERGETVTLYNGTEQSWTSKLELHTEHVTVHAMMHISESVPPKMQAVLRAKRDEFNIARSQLL